MNITFTAREGPVRTIEDVDAVTISRSELRDRRSGRLIARHIGHHWNLEGTDYLRVDCAARLRVAFVDEQGAVCGSFGPLLHFSSIDGIAFGDHEVIGHFDNQRNVWYVLKLDRECPVLILEPAA